MAATKASADRIIIRKAEQRDCSQIYTLVKELASFLNCEKEMELTIDQFHIDLFGDKPVCYCIVATSDDDPSTIIGYALYFHIYDYLRGFAISMENLYVSPTQRGSGIGKMLWKEVTRIGLELGATGILICVDNWNTETKNWYSRYGCVDLVEAKDQHYMNFPRKDMEAFIKEDAQNRH